LGDFRYPQFGRRRGRSLRRSLVNAGRNDGHADNSVKSLIKCRADDDVGVLIHLFTDARRCLVDFVEHEVATAGQAEIERARGDGRWDAAYASQSSIDVPDDLAIALAAQPRALAMFEILTSQNRYAVLYRIGNAKKAETRARRIEQFVAMLARGETVYPQARSLAD